MTRAVPVPVLVVAVAVLLAGCGAGTGSDGGRTVNPALADTPTASPTPTAQPSYPPGVTAERVDVRTLARSHDRALRDVNSTVRFRRTAVAANGTVLSTRRSVIERASGRLGGDYVRNGSLPGEDAPPIRGFAFWTNGSVTALRTVDDDGTVSYRAVPGEPPTVASTDDSGEGLLVAAFDGTGVRLTDTVAIAGERLYVLTAERERLNRSGTRVENFSATAYITEEESSAGTSSVTPRRTKPRTSRSPRPSPSASARRPATPTRRRRRGSTRHSTPRERRAKETKQRPRAPADSATKRR
ncbi:hypothetical protein ACFQFH_10650 [Halobaculum halobium]|uniref:hypothetical protein n=1 Tax=Halobaculum halobium TaxID=3032281 RepID=UPI00361211A5